MAGKRCSISEAEQFTEYYRKYFHGVYQYVHRRILNRQMTEDIVQDTFCMAYIKGRDFLEHSQPQLWLLRTARNKMLELYRKTKYRSTVPLEEETERGQEELNYEVKELEVSALATLSVQEWKLVKNHYLYGVTISELAEWEGISENNMRVRLSRMKKRLRDDMG